MWRTLKDLSLGLALLAAASAALLLSDLSSRQTETSGQTEGKPVPVALLQHASNPVLDETVKGIIDALADRGFRDGERIHLQRYNAEGDIPTANTIATRISDGSFPVVATVSTLCLQAVANANRNGNATQVFCAVSDPVAAGVGIKSLGSLDKPGHLTGVGTAQPVEDIFRVAKRIRPELRTVGVVWNPAEANSEVCTRRARAICKELGIELVEAPIEGTRDVREAALTLIPRGAQAFWTGGDATVINAMDTLVGVARQNHIPIFSNISGHTKRGALFDLGANYYQVGRKAGELAADVLSGRSAAEIPVDDFMPRELNVNLQALEGLRDGWQPPAAVLAEAVEVIREDGSVTRKETAAAPVTAVATPPPVPKKVFKISAIGYIESVPSEESLAGFRQGMAEAGLEEGTDFVLKYRSALGDMAVLPALFAAAELDKPDLILVMSTPTLQTAVRRVKNTSVVFTLVADPVMAGAGRSDKDHIPNITGVYVMGPFERMADLLQKYYPQWKRVGSLVTPAEDNSVHFNKCFGEALAARGITLVTQGVNGPNEIVEAAPALCRQEIDAIVQCPDNLMTAGFSAVVEAARRARMPLMGMVQNFARDGASLTLSRDYVNAGYDAGKIAARVLRGENPAKIPFVPPSKTVLTVNPAAAKAQGVVIPRELLEKADLTIP